VFRVLAQADPSDSAAARRVDPGAQRPDAGGFWGPAQ
jgi:hypothetical protein